MKRFKLKYLVIGAVMLFVAAACKKEHYIDGGVHSGKLDMNIYEFLKSRPFEFDTIVQILDRTGLAEEVQKDNITFFAPRDFCVVSYLKRRGGMALKDVPDADLKAAMMRYIIPGGRLWRDDIPFASAQSGPSAMLVVSLGGDSMLLDAPDRQAYNGVAGAGPKFFRIWASNGFFYTWERRFAAASAIPEAAEQPDPSAPIKYYNPWISSGNVVTSDLQATNGNIQVLNGTHTFAFPYK